MALSNYASLIQSGVLAKLVLDDKLKISGGTLAVKALELEPPQPDDATPDLTTVSMPYVGVTCTSGTVEVVGTGPCYKVNYEVRIRCACEKNTASTAAILCQDMADAAVGCLLPFNGVSGAIVTSVQVFIEHATIGDVKTGEYDNPYLAENLSIVSAYVLSQ